MRMVTVAPDVAGRAAERYRVLPSAIRTLSVLTLLSAVTGSVVLTHQGKPTQGATTEATAFFGSATTIGRDTGAGRASRSAARTPLTVAGLPDDERLRMRAERAQDIALGVKYRQLRERRWAAEKAQARQRAAERRKALAQAAQAAQAAQDRRDRSVRAARSSGGSGTSGGDPRSIARAMLAARGWSGQFGCLNSLFMRESGWNVHAANPSGAYGIPQALPGRKMASAGSDWRTNPATQIRWGLNYIGDRYGSPCGAWAHSQRTGWY
jgi:hypothetical protein